MTTIEQNYLAFRASIEPELDAKRFLTDPDVPSTYLQAHKRGVKRRRLQPALKGRRRTKYQEA